MSTKHLIPNPTANTKGSSDTADRTDLEMAHRYTPVGWKGVALACVAMFSQRLITEDGQSKTAEDIASDIAALQPAPPTILTPDSPLSLSPTAGTYAVGDKQLFHITPSGAQDLTLTDIVVPTDSAITFPKTLNDGELYIVQITYSGSFWMLTSLVGGYPTPA
jgi:hypothetical protein